MYTPQTPEKKSVPRRWTKEEGDFLQQKLKEGYSKAEIAQALGRTETSVGLKAKRLQKTKSDNSYNEKHLGDKYEANNQFINSFEKKPKTLLDVYAGVGSYWKNNHNDIRVTTNDIDKNISADFNMDSLRVLCKLYSEKKTYDIIDLDPFGSAYDCFDLVIKMSKKGLIVTFGEVGHLRWKRLDFVNKRYKINSLDEYIPEKFIEEIVRIGIRNKKKLTPVIVKEYRNIIRVYFKIDKHKEVSQWKDKS